MRNAKCTTDEKKKSRDNASDRGTKGTLRMGNKERYEETADNKTHQISQYIALLHNANANKEQKKMNKQNIVCNKGRKL